MKNDKDTKALTEKDFQTSWPGWLEVTCPTCRTLHHVRIIAQAEPDEYGIATLTIRGTKWM